MIRLEREKRKIIDQVKRERPRASLSEQLSIARERTQDINDELFEMRIQQNQDVSLLNEERQLIDQSFNLALKQEEIRQANRDKKLNLALNLY